MAFARFAVLFAMLFAALFAALSASASLASASMASLASASLASASLASASLSSATLASSASLASPPGPMNWSELESALARLSLHFASLPSVNNSTATSDARGIMNRQADAVPTTLVTQTVPPAFPFTLGLATPVPTPATVETDLEGAWKIELYQTYIYIEKVEHLLHGIRKHNQWCGDLNDPSTCKVVPLDPGADWTIVNRKDLMKWCTDQLEPSRERVAVLKQFLHEPDEPLCTLPGTEYKFPYVNSWPFCHVTLHEDEW